MTLAAELGKPITQPSGKPARKRGNSLGLSSGTLLPFLLPLVIVLLWQAASSFGWITNRLMPAPIQVVWAFWDKLTTGELAVNIQASATRAISGLLVGGSIGFLLGLANGMRGARLFRQILSVEACKRGAGPEVIRRAWDAIADQGELVARRPSRSVPANCR